MWRRRLGYTQCLILLTAMRFSDERVDAVANTGGTYGEFISSVIKSEHSPLISGISCELAGYAFSRSSFEGNDLHAVGSVPARSSVATTMSGE